MKSSVVDIASEGQAIDWDPSSPKRLWSISRSQRELVSSDLAAALGQR